MATSNEASLILPKQENSALFLAPAISQATTLDSQAQEKVCKNDIHSGSQNRNMKKFHLNFALDLPKALRTKLRDTSHPQSQSKAQV